jgi:hypothetical protein
VDERRIQHDFGNVHGQSARRRGATLYKATHPNASPVEVKSALQGSGTRDWTWPSQDRDRVQEKLLNVAGS